MALPQITWQDVQQMPDDGNRYEAIDGDLHVTAAPNVRHQSICGVLYRQLWSILVEPGHGRLWFAPVGVEFPGTGEGVQPDLVFVSNERRGIIAEDWLRGAPDLVVEVLSPSTAARDRGVKRRLYERSGVSQYWLVDPDAEAVDVWRFGSAPQYDRYVDALPVAWEGTLGVIDLGQVFADAVR